MAPRARRRRARTALPRAAAVAVLLLAIAGLPGSTPALAGDRVFRLLDQRDGLPAGEVVQLAQDSRGFIWMGSFAGLVRYDGEEFRRWAPERLNGHVRVLITGPGGEVLVGVEPGGPSDAQPTMLYRVVPDGIEPVSGPDGTPLSGVADAAFGSEGLLCVTQAPDVACRLADGTWVRHVLDDTHRERARWIRRGPSATVLVATDAGLWRIDAGGARRIASLPDVADVVPHPDGSLFATTFAGGDTGRLVRIAAGVVSPVVTLKARPIDMAVRGDVIWASFDRFVIAVRPGEPPEILGPEAGLPSGGPLLVDHEGSLWLGTYSGVMHLPEPETVVWTERDGLVSAHTMNARRHHLLPGRGQAAEPAERRALQMTGHWVSLAVAVVVLGGCGPAGTAAQDADRPAVSSAAAPAAPMGALTIGDITYEFRVLRCDLTGSAEDGILLRGNGTAPDGRRLDVEVERLAPPTGAGTTAERVTLGLRGDGDRDAGQWEARRETSMFDNTRWIHSYADKEPADGPLLRISGTELVAADDYVYSLLLTPARQRQFTSAERRKFLDDARETRPGTLRVTCPAPAAAATP